VTFSYRNECDMRKLLVSDLNDLRHQQEDLKRAAGQGMDEADDPVRLKLSLQVKMNFRINSCKFYALVQRYFNLLGVAVFVGGLSK